MARPAWPLLLMLLTSCSKEDPPADPESPQVALSAFLNTGSEELQLDVVSGRNDPQVISLSDELGLENLVFSRREITRNSIAFYSWQGQQSRVYYKDLGSGEVFRAEDICGFSQEELSNSTIRRVSGNESYVVMPYAEFTDGANPSFSLRILEKATDQCRDLPFPDVNPSGIENYDIEGDLLALYYLQEGTGTPLISLVDLASASQQETLILDNGFVAATFRGTELWIFNQDGSYLVYNAASGNFTRSGMAPGLPSQGPGMFESHFEGDRLLVRYIYQQPSLFFAQPALYDFALGELTEGSAPFLPELQARVEQETGDRVLFGKYAVDIASGTLAIIYVRGNGLPEGGVVLTSFGLDWLEVLPLPYVPEHIEIRSVR